jgi:uncharacterized protein
LAELPAAPCLSSRVETGIAIEPNALAAVHEMERLVQQWLAPQTVRCRLRSDSIVIELDPAALGRLTSEFRLSLSQRISERFGSAGVDRAVEFKPYRMGSAFLR